MSVYPAQFFTEDNALIGIDQSYKSSVLNRKFTGQPKGVYVGFIPSTATSVLTLSIDATENYSVVKIPSSNDSGLLDIVVDSDITLDFAAQPSVDFPIQVIARVRYFDDPTIPTRGELVTRSGSILLFDEVRVCYVDGPPASISVRFDSSLAERDEPLALIGVDFGFMPGGAIEDLQSAADIVNEVVAARLALGGTTHTNLSARIADDYSSTSMGSRLSVVFRALRSNDYLVEAEGFSAIVSGSFVDIERDHNPTISLGALGSETTEGAVAGPNDSTRNVVLVVNSDTGYRLVADVSDRNIVFGRLDGPGEATVGGDWFFANASKDVIGTGGAAIADIRAGDTILGPDGKRYEISTVVDNNTLSLRTAFRGTTDSTTSTTIHRWLLSLKTISAGLEINAPLPATINVRFFFPAFLTMARDNSDWRAALHSTGEREPIPSASTTVPGIVSLTTSSSLLGSVTVQNTGVELVGGPFHTINFNAAEANLTSIIDGEVTVVEVGPQGAKGPTGTSGAPGPVGGVGPGYSVFNPFVISAEFGSSGGSFSFTQDMSLNIRYLHGNVAKWRDASRLLAGSDSFNITNVSVVSTTEGRIEGTLTDGSGENFITLFLSAAGD